MNAACVCLCVCMCVYIQRSVSSTDVQTAPIASTRPFSLCGCAHAGTSAPACAQQRVDVRKANINNQLQGVICLESIRSFFTLWMSPCLAAECVSAQPLFIDVAKKKKKKVINKNRVVGSWNAATAFSQSFRNLFVLFFFGSNFFLGGGKGVLTST